MEERSEAATNVCPQAVGQGEGKAREEGTPELSLRTRCAHGSRWGRRAGKLGHRGRHRGGAIQGPWRVQLGTAAPVGREAVSAAGRLFEAMFS